MTYPSTSLFPSTDLFPTKAYWKTRRKVWRGHTLAYAPGDPIGEDLVPLLGLDVASDVVQIVTVGSVVYAVDVGPAAEQPQAVYSWGTTFRDNWSG